MMTKIDLLQKSTELKDFVSQFETQRFLGDLCALMPFIKFGTSLPSLKGLSSPLRQLLYLAGLNVSSKKTEDREMRSQFYDEDFLLMKRLLNEIEEGYQQIFYPLDDSMSDEDGEIEKDIAMPAFLSYFNQGLLNYEEQVIERIETYFSTFDKEITTHFGLSVQDFIAIYNFIDAIPNKFLTDKIHKKEGQQSWEEFSRDMKEKGVGLMDLNEHLPEHFQNQFEWTSDHGLMLRFSRSSIVKEFGEMKSDAFLRIFTCERKEGSFLYYTEKNPIYTLSSQNLNTKSFLP